MRLNKDSAAGLLFVVLGLAAILVAKDYEMGTARAMGPGYIPVAIGGLIALLGAALAFQGLRAAETSDSVAGDGWALRPLLTIVAGIIAFALMVRPAGLVASILAVVIIVRLAERGARPIETLVLGAVLAAICTAIFVVALGIPMRVFPWA